MEPSVEYIMCHEGRIEGKQDNKSLIDKAKQKSEGQEERQHIPILYPESISKLGRVRNRFTRWNDSGLVEDATEHCEGEISNEA